MRYSLTVFLLRFLRTEQGRLEKRILKTESSITLPGGDLGNQEPSFVVVQT